MKSWLQNTWQAASRWLNSLNASLTFLSILVTLAFAYFAFVEWRVERIVKDPNFVAEVARKVRPAVVFNANGSIMADSGAMDLLESPPTVALAGRDGSLSIAKIVARPKRVVSEPILESLDISNVSVAVKRGVGLSWEISVVARSVALVTSEAPSTVEPARFRLELSPR